MWQPHTRSLCAAVLCQRQCQRLVTTNVPKVMAIRRETINVWERRAPLSPRHVGRLVKSGIRVLVQPSNRRAYNMQEYAQRGAVIQEDLSEASLIVGVKSVPIDLLLPDKTYAFFSHVIKAQEANMPLLDAIIEKNIRLIDYEKMVDEDGQRVVAFGKYAGVAGMINILHGLGLRLLALGHHTPFMHIGPSHNYRNTEMARQAVRDAGYEISLGRLPKSIGPLVFVFTGSGNVSQGAQEVFQEFPFEYIPVSSLENVSKHGSTSKLYACVVSREDHFVRKDGGKFDAKEFEMYPSRYASVFSHKIAPYASCIVHGIYWDPGAPRLLTIPDAKTLLQPQKTPWIPSSAGCPQLPHRLLAISDISADPGGSIEFMQDCTTIDSPFCLYDADRNMNRDSFAGDGVLICSIDNMPAQIPREATDFFGALLLPHIKDMINSNALEPFDDFNTSSIVKDAVITSNGKLTPNFEYITQLRLKKSTSNSKVKRQVPGQKRVLILGAGYVSAPAVEYLIKDKDVHVTVVSQFKRELESLTSLYSEIEDILMDITRNQEELEKLISESDVVVSLLPYSYHPDIAKMCISHKTHMVTASYVSPAMRALHQDAVDAGITIMNEVGVDPGIDHMLAMECFDEVKNADGKITSFVSWCGGLPAPEHSNSPLLYKFSWFPRGVLMNCLNGARYLKDNHIVDIPGGGGLLEATEDLKFLPGFSIEGFPNRDSTMYADAYGIQTARTILRGTIRYKGFSDKVQAIKSLGLLDETPTSELHPNGPELTWKAYWCEKFGKPRDLFDDSLKDIVYDKVGRSTSRLDTIDELGLLEDELIDKKGSPLDTLTNYLAKRLSYAPGERDILIMHHDIGVQWADGFKERRKLGLVVYGEKNGHSAMAKTVGLPTGIATKMVLEGEIQKKGIQVPLTLDVYKPILQRLEEEGLSATEVITRV